MSIKWYCFYKYFFDNTIRIIRKATGFKELRIQILGGRTVNNDNRKGTSRRKARPKVEK